MKRNISDNKFEESKKFLKKFRLNHKKSNKKKHHKLFFTVIFACLIIFIIFYKLKIPQIINLSSLFYISTDLKISFKQIDKYVKLNIAGKLTHYKFLFYKRENPKISIIISTFNGEIFLKPAVRSIQNQNFFNI